MKAILRPFFADGQRDSADRGVNGKPRQAVESARPNEGALNGEGPRVCALDADRVTLDLSRFVDDADAGELPRLIGELEAARTWARLTAPPSPKSMPTVELNIPVGEAARRLGVSRDWIYKNARTLPFVARIGTRVVCSAAHVEKFRTARLGGSNGWR